MGSPFDLAPGTVFAREFRITGQLSRGGMSALYTAEQVSTGKQRAIKVLHPLTLANPRAAERFTQEARIGASIDSDHVVEVVSAGIDEPTGAGFLVMELLRGETLRAFIERKGRASAGETATIVAQLCHALGAAHRMNLVHRDIKPDNVFLATPRTQGAAFMVKLLDFGIAKWLQESSTSATTTGVLGSPLWMAPEQTDLEGRISVATDVWALGLLVYTMLTGKTYWREAPPGAAALSVLLRQIVLDPLTPPSERARERGVANAVPQGFDAWFARCVARPPKDRYHDANEALAALLPVLRAARDERDVFGDVPPTAFSGTPAHAERPQDLAALAELGVAATGVAAPLKTPVATPKTYVIPNTPSATPLPPASNVAHTPLVVPTMPLSDAPPAVRAALAAPVPATPVAPLARPPAGGIAMNQPSGTVEMPMDATPLLRSSGGAIPTPSPADVSGAVAQRASDAVGPNTAKPEPKKPASRLRRWLIALIVLLAIAFGAFATLVYMGEIEIHINMESAPATTTPPAESEQPR